MSESGLYVQMFSIHGLVRLNNPELGRDADTGGQVLYVVELVKHLAKRDDIRKVELFTRLISDSKVSDDYARPIEKINDKCRLIRIQCGGKKYMRKELLWPHLDEYIDKTIKFIIRENDYPDIVHGHYPDAGYVAMNLSNIFGLPFVFTGHSLGISKKQKLLNDGMKESEINKIYKMDTRIAAEENTLKSADLVIASTNQEMTDQYGSYMNSDVPEYKVIPPAIDVDRFYPFYHDRLPEEEKSEMEKYAQATLLRQLDRFLIFPDKPLILALSRPDKRKNITGLIKAYGEDQELQALANLAIFAGIRKDIDEMEDNEKDVLTRMLLEMDRYDLYGKLAIPKKHDVEYEVPALYRIAAEKHGVFVNPAMTEPFGLTLLEAGAAGLPLVATNDGGPRDIIGYCDNGILVDATNTAEIAEAIKKLLTDTEYWETCSRNGIMNVRKYYTWDSHADIYLKELRPLAETLNMKKMKKSTTSKTPVGKRLTQLKRFLVVDVDDVLMCENTEELDNFSAWITNNHKKTAFCTTSVKPINELIEFLEENQIPAPDILISSAGTEIYYSKEHHYDNGWESHISNRWEPEKIKKLLKQFDFLTLGNKSNQRKFKISYKMPPKKDRVSKIHDLLSKNKCRYSLVYYDQEILHILPYRASKGKAIRYISYKWETPLSDFLICANTAEMLTGDPLCVAVGSKGEKKDRTGKVIKKGKGIYFAEKDCAGGVLEGIARYRFAENVK